MVTLGGPGGAGRHKTYGPKELRFEDGGEEVEENDYQGNGRRWGVEVVYDRYQLVVWCGVVVVSTCGEARGR